MKKTSQKEKKGKATKFKFLKGKSLMALLTSENGESHSDCESYFDSVCLLRGLPLRFHQQICFWPTVVIRVLVMHLTCGRALTDYEQSCSKWKIMNEVYTEHVIVTSEREVKKVRGRDFTSQHSF